MKRFSLSRELQEHESRVNASLRSRFPLVQQLIEFQGGLVDEDRSAWGTLGLGVGLPNRHGGYWCSPRNSLEFASTGGDGNHFSFMIIDGQVSDASPVTMTYPAGGVPNVIVGKNLHEFLCLGVETGYFVLENISLKRELAPDPDMSDRQRSLLRRLAKRFDLRPWKDVKSRLRRLREKYQRHLDCPTLTDYVPPRFNDFTKQEVAEHHRRAKRTPLLRHLWDFYEQRIQQMPELPLDGLYLIDLNLVPMRNGGYWCTPRNAVTFACSGHGHIHYSLVAKNGIVTDESPVVLTDPGYYSTPAPRNFVVGENLRDFLCLGSKAGFLCTSSLVREPRSLGLSAGEEIRRGQRLVLEAIRHEFSLKPWGRGLADKLRRLHREYFGQLQIPFSK